MKKLKIGMLTCATMIAVSTISFGTTGVVNTDNARIRSEASANASIIDLVSIKDKVEVLEESGDWYKIKTGEKTGFVNKSLIDVDGKVEKKEENKTSETTTTTQNPDTQDTNDTKENEANSTVESSVTEEENSSNTVTTETTNNSIELKEDFSGKISSEVTIKILPSINSIDIAKIEKDTEIVVKEIINDWSHIETSKFSGWVPVKIVENAITTKDEKEQQESEEEQKEETTTETKIGYVNVESVNVRKEKNTSSDIIDNLTKNTEITILAEEEGWYKVKIKDLVGYISKQYISDKKVEEVTSRASDTARQILDAKAKEEEEPEEEPEEEKVSKTTTNSSEGKDVVSFAKQYLGYNYVAGGKRPDTGFDCSGFTSYVYRQFGVDLSGSSTGQKNAGTSVSKSELQPGDLLIFNNSSNSSVGHVGIYAGNDQFIHAANSSKGVITTSLSSSYYEERYVDARRVIE